MHAMWVIVAPGLGLWRLLRRQTSTCLLSMSFSSGILGRVCLFCYRFVYEGVHLHYGRPGVHKGCAVHTDV